ncbi:MAG: hypothetical protein PHN45_03255 [Methylococcales bacterium]|nr:hypothetical protein [Methylococcales bacterium]
MTSSRIQNAMFPTSFKDRGGYFKARYYQDIAIAKILEAVGNGQQRILF